MEYGSVLPADFNIPTSAFWLRNDLTKRNPFTALTIKKDDLVMDCGAYIGTFTAAALEQGAAAAVCYEASPKTAEILRANLARYTYRTRVIEAALVATNQPRAVLSMAGFDGANSIVPRSPGKKTLVVDAVNFRNELLRLNPHVIKMDVEGAEYDLLAALQPGDLKTVREICLEFHPIEQKEERILELVDFFMSEGLFVTVPRPRSFTLVRR